MLSKERAKYMYIVKEIKNINKNKDNGKNSRG